MKVSIKNKVDGRISALFKNFNNKIFYLKPRFYNCRNKKVTNSFSFSRENLKQTVRKIASENVSNSLKIFKKLKHTMNWETTYPIFTFFYYCTKMFLRKHHKNRTFQKLCCTKSMKLIRLWFLFVLLWKTLELYSKNYFTFTKSINVIL